MPDETTPANAQAANASDTSAQAATQTTPDAQAADGQEPITLEEARRLRSEGQALRKRLKAFEDAQAQAEAAKLTEQERLQKHASDLQAKYDSDTSALTERIVRYEVERQASKLGIVDPDAAAKLIDWSALEYDEDGTPTNAETLLKDLLKARPWLAQAQQGKAAPSSGGATNPSRTAASSNAGGLSWDAISKMTSEQYNARGPEIMAWMKKNPPKGF
jgi:hypothetical protein